MSLDSRPSYRLLQFMLAGLPFLALFIFPWQVTLVAGFAAGIVFPPLALLVGILTDVLYHTAGFTLWGTIWGVIGMLSTYAVRYIARTRIM